ncbi:MAG: hypothetical protein ACJAQ3_004140, partial [Planctomycetota bacterium]
MRNRLLPLTLLAVPGLSLLPALYASPGGALSDEKEPAPTRALDGADLESFGWRSLGPSTFGGRVLDIAC